MSTSVRLCSMGPRGTARLFVAVMCMGAACGGRSIGHVDAGVVGTGAAGTTGAAGLTGSTDGAAGAGAGGTGDAGVIPDSGFVGWRLLTNREYDNTVLELLGVEGRARATFIPDGSWLDRYTGFSSSRYDRYFNEAERLAAAAFAYPAVRDRVVVCPRVTPGSAECLHLAIENLAQRAWRRPISSAEAQSLAALAQTALDEGKPFDGAMQRVLAGLLSSAPFLYRMEFDPSPTSTAPHALTPWELASRLSFMAWSSMPDARLFALAADGSLAREDVLAAELDRLLADGRANAFVDEFMLGWFLSYGGVDGLAQHVVEPTKFPAWTPTLAAAMAEEARLYATEFLRGDRSFATFPEADFNFVNAELAQHYGYPTAGLGTELKRIEVTGDRRQGFLGLGAFLTATSFSYRTSPTLRGKFILEAFLCAEIPIPPPDVTRLDTGPPTDPIPPQTLRERLAEHNKNKACSGCHILMDPSGLALEEFDHVGRYRKTYADGMPIDTSGSLPDVVKVDPSGELPPLKTFDGLSGLASLLARDQRFLDCVSRAALAYASGKRLDEVHGPSLQRIRAAWAQQGSTLRALLKRIVLDDTFRTRSGEKTP